MIQFTKLHGLGNDYLFIDCLESAVADPESLSVAMSDRHCGVGADGIILVLPSDQCDFRMRMFNADGSEAETCGNGIRCFAKYVYEGGMTDKLAFSIDTLAGPNEVELSVEDGRVLSVRSDMGEPKLMRAEIPMTGPQGKVIDEPIDVDGETYRVTCVSMGNPHAVFLVDDVESVPLAEIGPKIEHHPKFPNRTNVEVVQVIDRQNIKVRVWERGSGIVLACGSGTCASVVASVLNGRVDRNVSAHLALGVLKIEWREDNRVIQEGPATRVFDGMWPEN